MGLQHYTQDMSKIPLKYHKKGLFYTKYTHPTLICRGTDGRTDGRTDAQTDGRTDGRTNIYSVFRDKLLLRGEHVLKKLAYSLIYDVIQCSRFDGDCDNHAARKIRREAHRPMERIGGFMRSH